MVQLKAKDIHQDENWIRTMCGLDEEAMQAWIQASKRGERPTMTISKRERKTPPTPVSKLGVRSLAAYKYIIQILDTDAKVLRIQQLIQYPFGTENKNRKVSGRTIDTLVTRFHKYHNVTYYIDQTTRQIVDTFRLKNDNILLFDIGGSYRQMMQQHSKTYFDCFARGESVVHRLKDSGKKIIMALCQFTFFIWADRFCVLDFLKQMYSDVIEIRKKKKKKKNGKRRLTFLALSSKSKKKKKREGAVRILIPKSTK
jgi:hypothetical protein